MITLYTTLLGGLHGTSPLRVFHWLFRENPAFGIIFLAAIVLYGLYRYNNRR